MTGPADEQWRPGLMTFKNQLLDFGGVTYRAKYAVLAMADFPPPKCPDLYDRIDPA